MADRVFKGRIIVTGAVADENRVAFPEASEDFNKPHKGGLNPFHLLGQILDDNMAIMSPKVETINGSLWVSGSDAWVKIDPDGHIEIGISGV